MRSLGRCEVEAGEVAGGVEQVRTSKCSTPLRFIGRRTQPAICWLFPKSAGRFAARQSVSNDPAVGSGISLSTLSGPVKGRKRGCQRDIQGAAGPSVVSSAS
jgi:hypothetical protein